MPQGEVKLEPGKDTQGQPMDHNYGAYEIGLYCSFRKNEELHRLTSTRQSGGERAVVTVLYLLALQGMTVCPFRVVDEIDQGMDENNQRKVCVSPAPHPSPCWTCVTCPTSAVVVSTLQITDIEGCWCRRVVCCVLCVMCCVVCCVLCVLCGPRASAMGRSCPHGGAEEGPSSSPR